MIPLSEQMDRARVFLEEIDDALEHRFSGLRQAAAERLGALLAQAEQQKTQIELEIDDKQIDLEEYLDELTGRSQNFHELS